MDGEPSAGRAVVYEFDPDEQVWERDQILRANNTVEGARFGRVVAISPDGNSVLIGANLETVHSVDAVGTAYYFSKGESGWNETEDFSINIDLVQRALWFGIELSLKEVGGIEYGLIGAPGENMGPWAPHCGAAYIFDLTTTSQ